MSNLPPVSAMILMDGIVPAVVGSHLQLRMDEAQTPLGHITWVAEQFGSEPHVAAQTRGLDAHRTAGALSGVAVGHGHSAHVA